MVQAPVAIRWGSQGSLPRVRRQPVEPHAGTRVDQRRLIATAPVVTRYFASRLGLSRAGIDAGSATHARKRRVKAPKAASWPTRIASGIAIRHSDPRVATAIPGWLDCNSVMRRCNPIDLAAVDPARRLIPYPIEKIGAGVH